MLCKGATLSLNGIYRYDLLRQWQSGKLCCFIGLNPSTADANLDDPTIRRCIGFAKKFGYAGFIMLNAYSYRATKPSDMLAYSEPIGRCTDEFLAKIFADKAIGHCIACWGNNISQRRQNAVLNLAKASARQLYCFGLTKQNKPKHPLYLPKTSELQAF